MLDAAIFTHADVPYRIATYDQILADPFETITFDEDHAARHRRSGSRDGVRDGRLVHGPDGELVRVTLAEKLLLLLLAKLVNLVPDGGIWMNTQRPEWNDANNALVGRGLSVVTLAQLRRYVEFVRGLITTDTHVTEEFARPARPRSRRPSQAHRGHLDEGFTDGARRAFMDDLGSLGSAYRERVYAGFSGTSDRGPGRAGAVAAGRGAGLRRREPAGEPARGRALPLLQHPRPVRRRGGGSGGCPRCSRARSRCCPAASSGRRSPWPCSPGCVPAPCTARTSTATCCTRTRTCRASSTGTRSRPSRAQACPLVAALVAAGDRSLVVADVHGDLHFAAGIRNARDVEEALDRLAADPDLGEVARASRAELLDIFEEVFTHAEFTGRSGSFFAYEGLGSIYWHMVSKLLLAVQETVERAVADGEPSATVQALAAPTRTSAPGSATASRPRSTGPSRPTPTRTPPPGMAPASPE